MPIKISVHFFICCVFFFAGASLAKTPADTRPSAQKSEVIARDAADSAYDDGPYASYQIGKPGLEVSWVCKNKIIRKTIDKAAGAVLKPECGFPIPITVRDETPTFPVTVKFTTKKLVALSDVHGQFDTMVRLLQANGIINREMKWAFGEGHMVMVGDMFDRGPKVTEVLWLLYQLDAEARAAGGAVHVLLGNHEAMVLYDDLRYVNPKYAAVAGKLNDTYPGLFGEQTVLGRWLRTKPMLVQVNDMLFVHGGLSPEYTALKLSVLETNESFRASLGLPRAAVRSTPLPTFLYGPRGPIWYRGYFVEPKIDAAELDKLLTQYAVKRIVVGHTTMNGVFSHFDGRVISVDSNIQKGVDGELFIWQEGKIARGSIQGETMPLVEYVKGAESGKH